MKGVGKKESGVRSQESGGRRRKKKKEEERRRKKKKKENSSPYPLLPLPLYVPYVP
ncbi:MAG: hypothetical protein HEQ29_22450 [Dolichospermum sp. LBC05a]|nr:hypothetical protein [Dolichospermum sp. OL01]MCO5799382.1 hypothetical protein [Dolichospermum sp. OL03]MCS6281190.1 hypothetical protein [Dolichospermum sp.]QSV60739.1 MAG: hypothetical protein HEQ29_22450 [Dolichospermum sp. LBC05a]